MSDTLTNNNPVFVVTHITDQKTNSGKTKVLLMVEGSTDRSVTLSTLLNLEELFPVTPLAKWHRLTAPSITFEDVETSYEKDGAIIELKKPSQTVWLNGGIKRMKPTPIQPTTVVYDEFDDAAAAKPNDATEAF